MSFLDTINKARQQGLSDEQILEAIKKQNPQKSASFDDAIAKGFTATQILNSIANPTPQKPTASPQSPSSQPTPPPAHISEIKITPEDFPKSIPSRPSQESKLWVRIFISLCLISITALSFTTVYRALFVPNLEPVSPQVKTINVYSPRAGQPMIKMYPDKDSVLRIPIESNEEIEMQMRRLIRDANEGEIIRIILEDLSTGVGDRAKIANLEDFFKSFSVKYPENFFNLIEKNFDLFIYTGEARNHLAFITKFPAEQQQQVEMVVMRTWEKSIEKDFKGLLSPWNLEVEETEEDLKNMPHRISSRDVVEIRYRESSRGVGLYYIVQAGYLIFATSEETVREISTRNNDL